MLVTFVDLLFIDAHRVVILKILFIKCWRLCHSRWASHANTYEDFTLCDYSG